MSMKFQIVLATTLALVDQFQSTLSSPQPNPGPTAGEKDKELDPLPLLSGASTALKSHVTKLSLLTITSPFTHSAVATTLSTLNESVLPSLVTATLLITPESHTKAFQGEIRVLAGTTLKELSFLVKEVQAIAEGKADKKSLEQSEKDTVTAVAGRVWDACDVLVDFAAKGVIGFVVRRAEEYRDLVRDAVEEIEGWDPDEEGDEFFDGLLGDDGEGPTAADKSGVNGKTDEDDDDDEESSTVLLARKKEALRILKPIAQIYPAIISNRLKKAPAPLAPFNVRTLESLIISLQQIPDHIDEVAGALYDADFDQYARHLGKAKGCASKAIELVVLPWSPEQASDNQKNAGDKFTAWSKTWTRVVEEVSKSIDESANMKSG
ncbi:hypothetical protein BJX76DRAFT_318331 [Aspergillus varians]